MGSSGSAEGFSRESRSLNAEPTGLAVTLVAHLVHPDSTLVSTSLFRNAKGELVVVADGRDQL